MVSALLFAIAVGSAAFAQQRNNQPRQQRGPEPAPGGFQNEAVDLNEGKSAAELFKSGCAVCHNSAAGLAKGRSDSQLVAFLRQHYTSGSQHASVLAGFLAANGRGTAATATPARLNPNAPVDRPPAPVGREEAARPQEREPAAKRKPHEKQPPVAARPTPAAPAPAAPAAPATPAPTTEAAAHANETPAAPAPVEEKPAPPEIPL